MRQLIPVFLLLFLGIAPAHAGINKCVADDGSILYTEMECPQEDDTTTVIPDSSAAPEAYRAAADT